MQNSNRIALKEWAVVCAALAAGRQTLTLRKGGIRERRGQFEVEHREFWLFPTYLHQNVDGLIEEAKPMLERAQSERPQEEEVRISLYAVVDDVFWVDDLGRALRLVGEHIWSQQTVEMRFRYRRPGLFVLPLRIYRVPQPFLMPNSRYFAGCRSWVELPDELPPAGGVAVLSDQEFSRRLGMIRGAIW